MIQRRVSAIVLAGGRSTRFGRDKLSEPIGGRSLLEHAIEAVRPFASEILVVVGPDGAPQVPGDVRIVRDRSPFGGPLLGLAVGLDDASEATVLVTAGDMPELAPEVVQRLLSALDASGVDVAVLVEGDRPRPLPMAVRRDAGRATTTRLIEAGERRLGAVTDALASDLIAEHEWRSLDPEGRSLTDIDTPEDLHRTGLEDQG